MRKSASDFSLITMVVGLFLALFVMALVVACNDDGGDTYHYPRDTTHGYYDTHHHYHYYPKYDHKSPKYVAPKVKPGGGGFSKPKSGGSRRR